MMRKQLLLICIFVKLLYLVNSNNIINGPHIFHGEEVTDISEYPFFAQFHVKSIEGGTTHHCGGSIISNRHIITADKSVIDGIRLKDVIFFIGSLKLGKGISYQALDVIRFKSGDIAMAIYILNKTINFDKNVQKVLIDQHLMKEGENATALGFKDKWDESNITSNNLLKLSLKTIKHSGTWWCSEDIYICALGYEHGSVISEGDFGGPLIDSNGKLIGVAVNTFATTSQFVRISKIYNEINDIIKNHNLLEYLNDTKLYFM